MKKYKYIIAISIIGCVYGILIISKRLYNYYSWAEEKPTNYHLSRIQADDTLKVIIIGDSWAAYHHDNDTLLSTMLQKKTHKSVHVISSGMIGAKTKAIYELTFDTLSSRGTQRLIATRPDYCIISAGINDAIAKMGPRNYCYHYGLIIKKLISAGITPVIIDMPDVGYYSAYKRESLLMKIRHRLSNTINRTGMWSFEEYRNALVAYLSENQLTNQIIYISSDSWNRQGFNDKRQLYLPDNIHLNARGYYLLDSCIADGISRY